MRLTRLVLTMSFAALAACAAPDDELWVDQGEIVGGTTTTGYLSSVAVMASNQTFRGQVFCSGTVIARRAVLTAAHCMASATARYVMIGSDPEAAGARFVPITDFILHPGYAEGTFEGVSNDIAVLILGENVPDDVVPVPLVPSAPGVGATVRWVAFGHTAFEAGDKGIKRTVVRQVSQVDGALITTGNASCKADSGGSVYVESGAELHLAGEVRGSVTMCTGVSSFISAAHHAAWITSTVEDNGGLGEGPDAGPIPHIDAGPDDPDASPSDHDAGDQPGDGGGGGCGCDVGSAGGAPASGALGLGLGLALLLARRRRG
jgi:MYXO-CTERM domain-containing protein